MTVRRFVHYAITCLFVAHVLFPKACLAVNSVESRALSDKIFAVTTSSETGSSSTSDCPSREAADSSRLRPITSEDVADPANKKSGNRQSRPQTVSRNGLTSQIQLGPLELRDSDDETGSRNVKLLDTEKEQLADLWDATIANNQDIRFVVLRLMPAKDPSHSRAVLTKLLSTTLYGAVTAGSVALPQTASMGGAMNRGGVQMIQQLLSASHRKEAKDSITESESLMLYNSVRSVADRLVENYHDYKKYINLKDMADHDFADLKEIVSSSWDDLSVKDQVELIYFMNKSKREIEELKFDLRRCRQSIVDLSGMQALDKLDKQIDIELAKVNNGTEIDSQASSDQVSPKN
jgi:hypothetical protein